MNVPVLVFWAVIAWSFTASNSTVLVLLLASTPFVSLALLPPGAIGMSLLPQSMFAVVLILKVLSPHAMPLSSKLWEALQLRHLGFLALFLVVGAVATVIMPRLFGGEVVIVPMRDIWGAEILSPATANFTQLGYVTLSVLTAIAVMLMADEPNFIRTLLTSVLAGGIVTVLTGLIDIAAVATGLEGLLTPFRNADYAYITSAEIAGVRRVVGFTPEASSYGNICVQFLAAIALLRTLYEGRQRVWATTCAASLGILALFSTSSTAYLGLAVLAAAYAVNWIRRAILSSSFGQSGLVVELFVGLGVADTLLVIWIINPNLFDPLVNLVNEQIFNKPLSSSFYERSFWNTTAWNAVISTWGLGVGFGSTRTSNWFAAVVSNAGLLGAIFMAFFLIQIFLKQPIWRTPLFSELVPALKLSLIPALFMASVVTAGPDFGIWTGVVFGAIAGIAALRPRHSSLAVGLDEGPLLVGATKLGGFGKRGFGRTLAPGRRRNSGSTRPTPRPSF
jgi:hypothetical protein